MSKALFWSMIATIFMSIFLSCAEDTTVYQGFTCTMPDRSVEYKVFKITNGDYEVWAFDKENNLQLMISQYSGESWAVSTVQRDHVRNCKILGGIPDVTDDLIEIEEL